MSPFEHKVMTTVVPRQKRRIPMNDGNALSRNLAHDLALDQRPGDVEVPFALANAQDGVDSDGRFDTHCLSLPVFSSAAFTSPSL
jgi:hypothetical protein